MLSTFNLPAISLRLLARIEVGEFKICDRLENNPLQLLSLIRLGLA